MLTPPSLILPPAFKPFAEPNPGLRLYFDSTAVNVESLCDTSLPPRRVGRSRKPVYGTSSNSIFSNRSSQHVQLLSDSCCQTATAATFVIFFADTIRFHSPAFCFRRYDQPVRFPRRSSLVSFSRPPFDPLCSPPPRWPYRRHPPKSPSPIQSNLPSIGSFLPGAHSPVAAPLPNFTPPLTPGGPRHISSPSYFGQRLSSSSPGPPNNASSPGIDSNAPTRPTPAASSERRASKQSPPVEVKRESHCDVDCFPDSRPSHEHTIKLSAYAAGMSPRSASRSPLVKEEPRAVLEQPCKAQQQFMSDSKENFYDSEVGGVAIAPGHGSVSSVWATLSEKIRILCEPLCYTVFYTPWHGRPSLLVSLFIVFANIRL